MHIQDNTGGYIKIADKSAVTASVTLQQLDKSAITASVTPQQQLHQSICLKATTSHCKEAKWRDAEAIYLSKWIWIIWFKTFVTKVQR